MRLPGRVSGRLATGAIAATACFAGLAVVAPLATYTVTLAVFGLPHVLSELRYVDRRFGRRLERCFLIPMAVLLPAIATIRAGVVLHVIPVALGLPAELGGLVLLALAARAGQRSGNPSRCWSRARSVAQRRSRPMPRRSPFPFSTT